MPSRSSVLQHSACEISTCALHLRICMHNVRSRDHHNQPDAKEPSQQNPRIGLLQGLHGREERRGPISSHHDPVNLVLAVLLGYGHQGGSWTRLPRGLAGTS
jgi:hypothetical protein